MLETSILKNGLTVATTTMPNTGTVVINIWVKTGSRYETLAQNGMSHFLEHMAFKGTKTRTSKDIAESFDNIGGYINASTSREHTVFYTKILMEHAELAMDILADILQNSIFDPVELERERGVILQEIAMTHDTPDDIIFDYFQETAFSDQPIGRSILGQPENIQRFCQDDFREFMTDYYGANNMVLSIAGNITHTQSTALAERYFGHLAPSHPTIVPPCQYKGGVFSQNRDLEQLHFVMGFEGFSYRHPEVYTVQLASILLGGGMSSRLFQEIREKRGLAYSVYSYQSTYCDAGMFAIYTSTNPSDIIECMDVIRDVTHNAITQVTEAELNRAKMQMKASLIMGYESTGFCADEVGRNLCCLGRHIPKEELIATIERITCNDVTRILDSIIHDKPVTIAALGNTEPLDKLDLTKPFLS